MKSLKYIFNSWKTWIIFVLCLIIAIFFSVGYVLGNYDPTNNLKLYKVGVVNSDKGSISKVAIKQLIKEKGIKVVNLNSKKTLLKRLNTNNDIRYGIVFDDNFSKTISSLDKFSLINENVNVYENSKINKMGTLINKSLTNELSHIFDLIVGKYSGPSISKLLKNKINEIQNLAKKVSKENLEVKDLKDDTFSKITYYENLIKKINFDVDNFKGKLGIDHIKKIFSKLNNEKEYFINKYGNKSKSELFEMITKNNFSSLKSDINNINNNKVKSFMQSNISSIDKNIDIIHDTLSKLYIDSNTIVNEKMFEQLIKDNNRIVTAAKDFIIDNPGISSKEFSFISKIYSLTSSLNDINLVIKTIDIDGIKRVIKDMDSVSDSDKIKRLTNLDINKIKLAVNDINNPKSKAKLQKQISKLKDGLNQLEDGMNLLNDKLQKALNKVDLNKISNVSLKLYQLLMDPININIKNTTPKQVSGQALAGFALLLGLWIVTLFTCDLIFKKHVNIGIGYVFSFMFLGLFAIIYNYFISMLNIKFSTINILDAIVFIGYVFYTIQRFFFKLMGPMASLFLTLFFIIQVVCSNATLPIELSPSIFGAIKPYIPLHYGVDIIRELSSTTNWKVVFDNGKYLLLFALVFHLLNFVITKLKETKNV